VHPKLSRISISLLVGLILAWSTTACGEKTTPVPDTPTPTPIVIITSTLPPTQTPIPSMTPVPPTPTVPVAPVEGQTISQLNVRSAPTAESNLLGSLPPGTAIQIVGKDPTSGWWLIVYPQSSNGTGWVTAQFVQASNTQNVPVISAEAQAMGNGSGAGTDPQTEAGPTVEPGSAESPLASVLTFATAFPDGDSPQSPAISITLSKASVRTFNYSSDISSPEGDPEDWLQFTLDGQFGQQRTAAVTITCSGGSPLNVELIQNNSLLQGWNDIVCRQPSQLQLYLYAGSPYYLRLTPAQGSNPVNYVAYTVIVQLSQ
jgi:hypothetical protein